MKRCSKCKQEKPLSEFSKDKSQSSGYKYQCKTCLRKAGVNYRKADKYKPRRIANRRWHELCRRVAERVDYSHVEVRMTQEEFMAWAVPAIEAFLQKHPNQTPSIDREDPNGHYEIGNIRVIDYDHNSRLAVEDSWKSKVSRAVCRSKRHRVQVAKEILEAVCRRLQINLSDLQT